MAAPESVPALTEKSQIGRMSSFIRMQLPQAMEARQPPIAMEVGDMLGLLLVWYKALLQVGLGTGKASVQQSCGLDSGGHFTRDAW